MRILVREDHLEPCANNSTVTEYARKSVWKSTPIQNGPLELSTISLGALDNYQEAGSFGGVFKNGDRRLGLTAQHVLSSSNLGDAVSTPSSLEVHGRADFICPYTDRGDQAMRRSKVSRIKEEEMKLIEQQFHTVNDADGLELGGVRVAFRGNAVGVIVANQCTFAHHANYHNEALQAAGRPQFASELCDHSSSLDYCLFELESGIGKNVFGGDAIEKMDLIAPGDKVEKVSRTTTSNIGHVNGYFLQRWTKICVFGENGESFCDSGDSGAAIVVDREGELRACGLLIGKNTRKDLGFVTPLDIIQKFAEDLVGKIAWESGT